MSEPLSPQQETLLRAVDEVLHYIWDPIGIAGSVGARDEYYGYVDDVFTLLCNGAEASSITEYLVQIAHEHMGLSDREAESVLASNKMVNWRNHVIGTPSNNSFKPNPLRGSA